MDKTKDVVGPGDRIEVIGGQFDGLRGTFAIGKLSRPTVGRLIVVRGDDEKAYPMPKNCFREVRLLDEP